MHFFAYIAVHVQELRAHIIFFVLGINITDMDISEKRLQLRKDVPEHFTAAFIRVIVEGIKTLTPGRRFNAMG